jgi:proteasome accessory factor B
MAVRADERLFSLILALIASRNGLTKEQILSTVFGYSPGYRSGASAEAVQFNNSLDRMFERDKEIVREMGVVIDTITQLDDIDDNKIQRYRISEDSYELPKDVSITSQEMALLELAASAWREGSLSADSRHALTKLISLGITADSNLIGVAPRIRMNDQAFDVLQSIQVACGIAAFSYIKPGTTLARERTAAPLGLTNWQGNWYVLAFDLEAKAERTFLLSRIVSVVRKVPNRTHERPSESFAERLQNELNALAAGSEAIVEVRPGTDGALRLGGRYSKRVDGHVSIPFADIDLLTDEIVSFGSDVRVIYPPELISRVISKLTLVQSQHPRGGAK